GCNDLRRSPDPVVADVARDRGHRDRRDDRDDRYHRKQLDEAEAGLCWRTAIPSCTHGATSSCKAHSAPRSTVLTSNYAPFYVTKWRSRTSCSTGLQLLRNVAGRSPSTPALRGESVAFPGPPPGSQISATAPRGLRPRRTSTPWCRRTILWTRGSPSPR